MSNVHVILGNQLFPIEYIKEIKPDLVFMREDLDFVHMKNIISTK